jgi:hypothetical protein
MLPGMMKEYLSNIFKTYPKGDSREESYYEHLAELLREFSQSQRKRKLILLSFQRRRKLEILIFEFGMEDKRSLLC